MSRYFKRNDITTEAPHVETVRGYVVKLIEDEDIGTLQTKINTFLIGLPAAATPSPHLVSCEIRTYDGQGNAKIHSATLTFYYSGDRQITQL